MTPLKKLTSGVAQSVLKYWLRQRGLRHSAANEEALTALIKRLIAEGDLTSDELRSGVREIEEYGGKRVYLRQLTDLRLIADKKEFEKHLGQLGISLSEEAVDSVRKPAKPTLNYVIWGDDEIRVKYSETHIHLKRSKGSREVEEERRSKFIVISIERATGFMTIYMDPPGEEHNHLNAALVPSDAVYTEYYFTRAMEIFGEITTFDLIQPVEHLLAKEHKIFDVRQDTGWTPDNYRYSFAGRADVRQGIGYKAAAGTNPGPGVPEVIRGWWLESMSEELLERDLWSVIKTEPSMIQFRADCLAKEVDYAISTIRSL